jgi:hypothetical protein
MNKLAVVLILVAAACGSKKEGDATSGKGTEGAAPAKLVWKKVGALGLEAEVPEDANIDDNTKGAGYPTATIWSSPTTFVSGAGDMSDLKPTIEETKTRLGKDNKDAKFTKEEKTADGWVLQYDAKSITGDPLSGISVRRTIGDKQWDCGTNAKADELPKVLKLCQSLRAAK